MLWHYIYAEFLANCVQLLQWVKLWNILRNYYCFLCRKRAFNKYIIWVRKIHKTESLTVYWHCILISTFNPFSVPRILKNCANIYLKQENICFNFDLFIFYCFIFIFFKTITLRVEHCHVHLYTTYTQCTTHSSRKITSRNIYEKRMTRYLPTPKR